MKKIQFKKRKAQLKIQEMSFMLLAVVLFFILVALFFITIKYSGLNKEVTLIQQEKALSTVIKLADTAEFSCGKPLCVDADKIMVLKDREAYKGFWQPLTSISVVRIFPSENQTLKECSLENYPDCNLFKIYDKQIEDESTVDTFVSLCRKDSKNNYIYDKCELGKLVAGFEVKQAG